MKKYFHVQLDQIELDAQPVAPHKTRVSKRPFLLRLSFAGRYKVFELQGKAQTEWKDEFCFVYHTAFPEQMKHRFLIIDCWKQHRLPFTKSKVGTARVSLYCLATGTQQYRMLLAPSSVFEQMLSKAARGPRPCLVPLQNDPAVQQRPVHPLGPLSAARTKSRRRDQQG